MEIVVTISLNIVMYSWVLKFTTLEGKMSFLEHSVAHRML